MLELDKKEILRYLGFKRDHELSLEVEAEVEQMMRDVQSIATPRYSFRIFDCQVEEETRRVHISGTGLELTGNSIYKHLKEAKKVVLLAATLGIEVERQIRQYELTEMSKALILDACCTDYVEKVCDLAECEIEQQAVEENLFLNRRFSPGYGDLSLDVQPELLAALDAQRRLGINLSTNLLMLPRKSVSAIIGLFDEEKLARPKRKKIPCGDCSMNQTCNYRR